MLCIRRNHDITFAALFLWVSFGLTSPVSAQKAAKAKTGAKATAAKRASKATGKSAAQAATKTAAPVTQAPKKTQAPVANPNAGRTAFNPQLNKQRAVLTSTEEKVNTLKEKIFRSKAQLMLLQEKLLHGVISTAKFKLVHDNRIGSSFYILSASYSIDGRPIFSRSDQNGSLNKKKIFKVFHESISPGAHRVTVDMRIRGNGFGLFSYLKGYKFRIRSSYGFQAQEGKVFEIRVVPFQKGWTVPLQKRIGLKYEVKVQKLQAKTTKKAQKQLNQK